jgi:paraquat-inducible protein B
MSKKANPAAIGGFVIGAIILVVAGIMIFGSGKFLTKKTQFVLYFPGSVKGLNIGAPVVFRGVRLGSVSQIQVEYDPDTLTFWIPVVIELEPDRIKILGGPAGLAKSKKVSDMAGLLIKRGLRAQLQSQSLVTGQLIINLDFHPGTEPRFVGLPSPYTELPTIPSKLEELQTALEQLPLNEIVDKALTALEGIDKFVNSPELGNSLTSLNASLEEVRGLIQDFDRHLGPVNQELRATLADARKLLTDVDAQVRPLAESFQATSQAGRETLVETRKAMANMKEVLGENSEVRLKLIEALDNLSLASRSLGSLAEYLDQNPDALLRGRVKKGER